jgi:hypothetical protein
VGLGVTVGPGADTGVVSNGTCATGANERMEESRDASGIRLNGPGAQDMNRHAATRRHKISLAVIGRCELSDSWPHCQVVVGEYYDCACPPAVKGSNAPGQLYP